MLCFAIQFLIWRFKSSTLICATVLLALVLPVRILLLLVPSYLLTFPRALISPPHLETFQMTIPAQGERRQFRVFLRISRTYRLYSGLGRSSRRRTWTFFSFRLAFLILAYYQRQHSHWTELVFFKYSPLLGIRFHKRTPGFPLVHSLHPRLHHFSQFFHPRLRRSYRYRNPKDQIQNLQFHSQWAFH